MVKKKVGGGQRFIQKAAKSQKEGKDPSEEKHGRGPPPPKHIKRKITKKIEFLDKVAKSSLASKGGVQKKSRKTHGKTHARQIDLSSLSGNLAEIISDKKSPGFKVKGKRIRVSSGAKNLNKLAKKKDLSESNAPPPERRPFGESVGTNKIRSLILEKETDRVQLVVAHPTYKKDPIAAITNHLATILPPHETDKKKILGGLKGKVTKQQVRKR